VPRRCSKARRRFRRGEPRLPGRPRSRWHALSLTHRGGHRLWPDFGDVILRRGSTRRFARGDLPPHLPPSLTDRPGSAQTFGRDHLMTSISSPRRRGTSRTAPLLAIGQVLELPRGGFRREAGYPRLEQQLGADASVVVLSLRICRGSPSPWESATPRPAQAESWWKIYLCAYALWLTTTTFCDDDATAFFSPHGQPAPCSGPRRAARARAAPLAGGADSSRNVRSERGPPGLYRWAGDSGCRGKRPERHPALGRSYPILLRLIVLDDSRRKGNVHCLTRIVSICSWAVFGVLTMAAAPIAEGHGKILEPRRRLSAIYDRVGSSARQPCERLPPLLVRQTDQAG
jgi:hypothetical protein